MPSGLDVIGARRTNLLAAVILLSPCLAMAAKPGKVRVRVAQPVIVAQPFEVSFSVLGAVPSEDGLRWEMSLHNRLKVAGDVRFLSVGVAQREYSARIEVTYDDFTWATDKDPLRMGDSGGGLFRTAVIEVVVRRGKSGKDILAKGTLELRVSCDGADRHPACQPQ